MKKWIFTLTLGLIIAGLTNAQVIMDPSTLDAGSLPEGMSIVEKDGTTYLQVVLNGWNSTLTIPAVTIGDDPSVKCTVIYSIGEAGDSLTLNDIRATVQLQDTVNKVEDEWNPGSMVPSKTAMQKDDPTGGSDLVSADWNDVSTTIHSIQFYGQETIKWANPTTGDTMWVGLIKSTNPNVIFDPADYMDSTLPAGMEIVQVDDEYYLKSALNGWSSTLAITPFEINTNNLNRFETTVKYAVGTGGVAIENIQSFVQVANSDYTKKAAAVTNPTATEFYKDTANFDASFTISQLQVAGQETVNWGALTGDTIYVGKIIAFYEEVVIEYAEPRAYGDALKVVDEDGIDLDGVPLEDTWLDAEYYDVVNTDSSTNVDAAFQGFFQAAWDEDYLYLYIEIDDATPSEYDGSDSWKKDGIQAYFDIRNQLLDGDRIPIRQHQITVPYTTVVANKAFTSYSDADLTPYYAADTNDVYGDYTCVSSSSGYSMELRVPWAAMYYNGDDIDDMQKCLDAVSIASGDTLGFQLQLNDYDPSTTNREHVTTWTGYSTDDPDSYENSGTWGALKLVGGGSAVENFAQDMISLYPNPTTGQFTIELEGMTSIAIFDMTGREVFLQNVNSSLETIDVSHLTSGIYMVRVQSSQGSAVTKLQVK